MNTFYIEIFLASCILIFFFYETNYGFRYKFKFTLYYIFLTLIFFFLIPFLACRFKNVRNFGVVSFFTHHISTILGLKWVIRGREYLEKDQSYIIVSNHQSSLDVLGTMDVMRIANKCTAVAKNELFYAGPYGLGIWLCGTIFIPRTDRVKAQKLMEDSIQKILQEKAKLWIFVEGTRRNTGEIHSFKKGAFHLAISAQIPILPIVFSQHYFLDPEKKRFGQDKIIVTCLPPIPTDNLTKNDVTDLLEQTRSLMVRTFQETNKEIEDNLSF